MDRIYIEGREKLSISQSLTSPSRSARAAHRAFAEAYGKLLSRGVFPSRLTNNALLPLPVLAAASREKNVKKIDTAGPRTSALASDLVLTADCITSGDVVLHIRSAELADESVLIGLFNGVDLDDLRFRFGDAIQTVNRSLIAPMVQSDRTVSVTFLASTADGTLVAASTLTDIRGSDNAEVALSVHASWKGKGVAWTLLEHTLTYATAHGLKEVTSFESGEDRLAVNLEREMGFVARLVSANPIELSLTKSVAAE